MRAPTFRVLFFLTPLLLCLVPITARAVARSLSIGMSGNDVATIQRELISEGFLAAGNANGYFGLQTQAAVEAFQCAQNVVCSGQQGYGNMGPKTQAALSGSYLQTVLTGASTARASGHFELSGWIPYWRAATGTEDVLPHLSLLTSVMPFGYTVSTDGELYDAMSIDAEPWTSFIAAAHAQKVRVVPSVTWGNGAAEQAILSNPTTRAALEGQIANVVKQQGFDGIDIDFEAKEAQTKDSFSAFLQGLYPLMGNKWVYCTVEARMPLSDRYDPGAIIPADATEYANDYVQMNKYCDRVEIMAYDQGTIDLPLNKVQTGPYSPVADTKWVADLVDLAAQTISRNKIIIGVPTYGYEYTVTPVTGNSSYDYQYQVLWPFDPRYATDLATTLGINPIRNSAGELSFSYHSSGTFAPTGDEADVSPTSSFGIPPVSYTDGSSTISGAPPFNYVDWSDATAIAQKVALAKQLGVRGVAIFKFDGAEDPNIWGVL